MSKLIKLIKVIGLAAASVIPLFLFTAFTHNYLHYGVLMVCLDMSKYNEYIIELPLFLVSAIVCLKELVNEMEGLVSK